MERWNAFNYGMGGESGNGMVNTRDHANIMRNLYEQQYQDGLRRWQMGELQNPQALNQMKNMRDRYAGEAATGQSTMMFARPQFETPWAEYNDTARLDQNRKVDLESILPQQLRGQNTGERFRGWFGGGVGEGGMGNEMALMQQDRGGGGGGGGGMMPPPQDVKPQPMNPTNNQPLPSMQIRNYGQAPSLNTGQSFGAMNAPMMPPTQNQGYRQIDNSGLSQGALDARMGYAGNNGSYNAQGGYSGGSYPIDYRAQRMSNDQGRFGGY